MCALITEPTVCESFEAESIQKSARLMYLKLVCGAGGMGPMTNNTAPRYCTPLYEVP